jgi:hypothetical protein
MMRAVVFTLALMLAGSTGAVKASAAESTTVHFAGFALSGNFNQAGQNFPYTSALISEGGKAALIDMNRALIDKIKSQTLSNISITTDLGDYKKGDALALAFVLTWENVKTERFEDFTKVAVDLQAEALLFNFATKQIVAAYPFGTQFIDSVNGTPDRQRIMDDVRAMYDSKSGDLLNKFAETLRKIRPKSSFGGRLQIVSASISQPAADTLAQSHVDPNQAQAFLENAFERYLTQNTDVPVLPHANNQAIGGVMAARFVNGDAFDFVIPPPDYRIQLTLNNARKVQVGHTDAETAFAYASYLDVLIDQPLSGSRYLDASVKYAVAVKIANSGTPDDAAEFQESLLAISDQITQQLSHPSEQWNDKWLVRQGQGGQFEKMPDLLEHCR